jgi:hypothetical protein
MTKSETDKPLSSIEGGHFYLSLPYVPFLSAFPLDAPEMPALISLAPSAILVPGMVAECMEPLNLISSQTDRKRSTFNLNPWATIAACPVPVAITKIVVSVINIITIRIQQDYSNIGLTKSLAPHLRIQQRSAGSKL